MAELTEEEARQILNTLGETEEERKKRLYNEHLEYKKQQLEQSVRQMEEMLEARGFNHWSEQYQRMKYELYKRQVEEADWVVRNSLAVPSEPEAWADSARDIIFKKYQPKAH